MLNQEWDGTHQDQAVDTEASPRCGGRRGRAHTTDAGGDSFSNLAI
jgi:hypothetical protein